MERNISLAYVLTFFRHSWFWLGIWILFYLRYTDYAGIGIIETVFFLSITVSEIPTGAIADLLGKKKTLIIAFFLQAIGLYIMSFTPHFIGLLTGVCIAGIGGSFYSGSLEALVYDSLKEINAQEKYDKVIANISSISLFAPAVCGIIGGYIYTMQPNLPFILNAIFYTIGIVFCFFLIEPHIDTEKFSLKNFIAQTKVGMSELLKTKAVINQTILLLSIGLVIVICDEMLNAFLGVEFGFQANELGVLWAVIFIACAFVSQLTPYLKKITYQKGIIVCGILIALSLMVTPLLGIWTGALIILIRSGLQTLTINTTSVLINENTQSKYRATTLSTFNLLKTVPYVLSAYYLGYLADVYSAITVSSILGIILLLLMGICFLFFKK